MVKMSKFEYDKLQEDVKKLGLGQTYVTIGKTDYLKPNLQEIMFCDMMNNEFVNGFIEGIKAGIELGKAGIDDFADVTNKDECKARIVANFEGSVRQHGFLDYFWNVITIGEALQDSVMEKCTDEEIKVWYGLREKWLAERRKQFPDYAEHIK